MTDLFRQEWTKTLEGIQGKRASAANVEESDLWAGVHEALLIAQQGGFRADGFRIDALDTTALPKAPGARVAMAVNGKPASVIVAVSTKDGGPAFKGWNDKLNAAFTEAVVGAVVVWPRTKLAVGTNTASYKAYAKRLNDGTVRPFPLDEHEATFHQLECLRQITRRAGNDLILQGNVVSRDDCRKLILDTGLLGT